jgi:hypothetical protein
MPNPAKPVELKRLQGNPGKKRLPDAGAVVVLDAGWVEPSRAIGVAGRFLWDSVFEHGGLWVSGRTDVHLLLMVCEQLDRREALRELFAQDPADRSVNMSLLEVEKAIASGLGALGFTPADRARLGLAEVRAKSKLEELMERRERLAESGNG